MGMWSDFEFFVQARMTCRGCDGRGCISCDQTGKEIIEVPCYIGAGNCVVADWRFLQRRAARIDEEK